MNYNPPTYEQQSPHHIVHQESRQLLSQPEQPMYAQEYVQAQPSPVQQFQHPHQSYEQSQAFDVNSTTPGQYQTSQVINFFFFNLMETWA